MKKINWRKVGAVAVGIVLLLLLFLNVKQYFDSKSELDAMHQELIEMKQLTDGIARSQSKYVSKEDLDKLAKDIDLNLDEIKRDLDQFDAEVKGISRILVSSRGRNQTNVPSSGTTPGGKGPPKVPCPGGSEVECPDPYGYLSNAQRLGLEEDFTNGPRVPIGSVEFKAWKEKPWTVDVLPRNYHITTVLGQDEDGRHYNYHKFDVEVSGEKHTVPVTSAEFVEELPEPSFHWWNPRVGIGVYGGVSFNTSPLPDENVVSGTVAPNISFSPFSYGKTKTKPEWVFARVGVGYDAARESLNLSVAPAMWNVGSKVEFIQNTYIGPVVGADIDGNVSVGVGFTTDF